MSSLFSPRGLWAAMTSADRLCAAGVLLLSIAPALALRAPDEPARAVVRIGTETVADLPLDRAGAFPFDGRRGVVVVTVEDGAVRVTESDCPQRVCVAMGAKRRPGELIACVPNALTIRLVGTAPTGGQESPDAIAR